MALPCRWLGSGHPTARHLQKIVRHSDRRGGLFEKEWVCRTDIMSAKGVKFDSGVKGGTDDDESRLSTSDSAGSQAGKGKRQYGPDWRRFKISTLINCGFATMLLDENTGFEEAEYEIRRFDEIHYALAGILDIRRSTPSGPLHPRPWTPSYIYIYIYMSLCLSVRIPESRRSPCAPHYNA